MNVTQRILLHVLGGAIAVTAIVATVTYRQVFKMAERQILDHVDTYATERLRREEAQLRTAYMRLDTVRGMFLYRDAMAIPGDIESRWNRQVRRFPDGGWRSEQEMGDPSLWGHRDLHPSPRQMHRLLNALDICRELMPAWVDEFHSVYFSFPGSACVGYNPSQLDWVWETPSDYPLEEQDWYYGARPEHNPSLDFVWTSIYPDPISGIPFATLMTPIMHDGEFVCTLAHDMQLERLFSEVIRSDYEGAVHMIVREDGVIIAHPQLRDEILASEGQLTAQGSGLPSLSRLFDMIAAQKGVRAGGFEPTSQSYFFANRVDLPGCNWYFITTIPQSEIKANAVQLTRWVWVSGLLSLAMLLGAFSLVLRRQLSRPLNDLTRAASAVRDGATMVPDIPARADELGSLASTFREMNEKVLARERELRQLNADLEKRVADRTVELKRINRRLEDALRTEKELGELRANFVSLVSHEFRTPLEVILTSSDILSRYLARLSEDKRQHHLDTIQESVKRMRGMMEDVLLLGRVEAGKLQFKPETMDVSKFCHRVIDEWMSINTHRCPIELQLEGDVSDAKADESLLRHICGNLLSNAIKFSPDGSLVIFRFSREGNEGVLTVTDHGRGIPNTDLKRLFQSFQRGSNVSDTPGTGLGLMIVKKCVDIHGGSITVESEEGRGATFTVKLPLFGDKKL